MAVDDLRNNYVAKESQTRRNKWKVPPVVTTGRPTRVLLSAVVQEGTEGFNRLAGFSNTIRNMSMGSRITRRSSDGRTSKGEGKNSLARGRKRRSVLGALNENERRPRTYSPRSGSAVLCGSSGESGKSTTYSSRHTNHVRTKYKRRMVQRVIQMACRRDAADEQAMRPGGSDTIGL